MARLVPFAPTTDVAEFADIIIDSAQLMVDGTLLSVSRGGWTFDPGEEWEDYAFPGRTMNTVGTRSLVRLKPTIKGTALLSGEDQITAFRPDGTWANHATIAGARTFTPNALRAYLTEYMENVVCLWKRIRGDLIAVEFPFAVCGNWGIGATDGDEGTIQITIEAVQDNDGTGTTKDRLPYRVRTVPTPDDASEPPIDEDLGDPILDLNAITLADLLDDGDPVTGWPDDSISGNDGGPYTSGGIQSAPTFYASGFGGGALPRVNMNGGTQGVATNLTSSTASQTFYFVVAGLNGEGTEGDAGAVNGPLAVSQGDAGSNYWVSLRGDGRLQSAVNTSAFVPTGTLGAAVDNQPGPHIIRFVWNRLAGEWFLYVDGVLDTDADSPAVSNSWVLVSRMYWGNSSLFGNKIVMDVGRILVYDEAHLGPGLTDVELALQAVWGTP
jgi:hypothetical protein